jgi:hypothetical protein
MGPRPRCRRTCSRRSSSIASGPTTSCIACAARDDYDPEALDQRALPFSSHYVSIEGRCLMQPEKRLSRVPLCGVALRPDPGEVYGRGPAQIVLPSLKTLNAEKVTFLKQGHRAADPVLLLPTTAWSGWTCGPAR